MAIQISGTTVIDNSRNINAGIVTFSSLNVPPAPTTFNPADGATGIALETNIVITFNQPIQKGTGNITLRNSSGIGTVLQTIGVTSTSVTISGAVVTIDPPNNLSINTDVFVVVDAGAFTSISFNSPTLLINTYNFVGVGFQVTTFTPANSATSVAINSNIILTFNAAPTRGTGTITLRRDSIAGTILESFDAASSGAISISGNNWILNPAASLPDGPNTIFLVIPSTAIVDYLGLNVVGADGYSFATVGPPSLGASYEGGFVICKASPLRWVVAPVGTQVARTWYNRDDANTTAQSASGCTGWFVPTISQLLNPGYCCRAFWDSTPAAFLWSSSQCDSHRGCSIKFLGHGAGSCQANAKDLNFCVRAFRCITY